MATTETYELVHYQAIEIGDTVRTQDGWYGAVSGVGSIGEHRIALLIEGQTTIERKTCGIWRLVAEAEDA